MAATHIQDSQSVPGSAAAAGHSPPLGNMTPASTAAGLKYYPRYVGGPYPMPKRKSRQKPPHRCQYCGR